MPQSKFSASLNLSKVAGQLGQAARKSGLQRIAVGLIDPNPRQPRTVFDEAKLEELAESLRQHGQEQPIKVRPTGDRYQLIAGERRWRAAQRIGWTEIEAIVDDRPADADRISTTSAIRALIENLHRDDLTPFDEITAVGGLVAEIGVEQAARALVRQPPWVSKRNRVATAPDFVRDFARSDAARDIEGLYELAKLAENDELTARRIVETFTPDLRLRDVIRAATSPAPSAPADPGPAPAFADAGGPESSAEALENGFSGTAEGSEALDRGSEAGEEFLQRNSEPNSSAGSAPDAPRAGSERAGMIIQSVVRRRGQITLITDTGKVPCTLTERAIADLRKLLGS